MKTYEIILCQVRSMLSIVVGSVALLAISGCTTIMNSSPEGNDIFDNPKKGIRYSLPAPHISLIPGTDGTIAVKVEYLPDPNNTYTLNVDSLLSNATFDVTLKNGMLEKLTLNSNSTATTQKAVETGKALAKAHLEAGKARKEKEKTAAEEQAKAAKKAADDVVQKKQEIKLLQVERDFLKDHNANGLNDEKISNLDLQIVKAETELEFLRQAANNAADAVASAGNAFNDAAAFSDPEPIPNPEQEDNGIRKAWGPVLFRVLPDGHRGVKLLAIEGQKKYLTSTKPKQLTTPVSLVFRPDPVVIRANDSTNQFVVESNKPLSMVDSDRSELFLPSRSTTNPVAMGSEIGLSILTSDSKKLQIVMPSNLTPGDYLLKVVLTVQGNSQSQQKSIKISWHKN